VLSSLPTHSIRHHLSIPSLPSSLGFNSFNNGSNISSPAISTFSTNESSAASVYDGTGDHNPFVFEHDSPDMMRDEDVSFSNETFLQAQAQHHQQQQSQMQQQMHAFAGTSDSFTQQQQQAMLGQSQSQTQIEIQPFPSQHPLAGFYDSYNGGPQSFYSNEEEYMDDEEDRMSRRYVGNGMWSGHA